MARGGNSTVSKGTSLNIPYLECYTMHGFKIAAQWQSQFSLIDS